MASGSDPNQDPVITAADLSQTTVSEQHPQLDRLILGASLLTLKSINSGKQFKSPLLPKQEPDTYHYRNKGLKTYPTEEFTFEDDQLIKPPLKPRKIDPQNLTTYSIMELAQKVQSRKYQGSEEMALQTQFWNVVTELDFAAVMKIPAGSKTPKSAGKYRLVPITAREIPSHSSASAATAVIAPEGVKFDYFGHGSKPYLDSSFAIGLTYEGTLCAVASGHTDYDGNMKIVQIQGVTEKANSKDPKVRGKSGLHSGILWRETLVQSWVEVAKTFGCRKVIVQSAANNRWLQKGARDNRYLRFEAGYDKIAERMGFTFDTKTSNWTLDLDGSESPQSN